MSGVLTGGSPITDPLLEAGTPGGLAKLDSSGQVLSSDVLVTDSGAANALIITPAPAIAAYATGQVFTFKVGAGNTNTGACTIAVSGLAVKNIFRNAGALKAGDLVAGNIYTVIFDGTQFQLYGANNYAAPSDLQTSLYELFTETGAVNAYAIAPAPAITAYALGQRFRFIPINTNTGPSTLAVNGLAVKNIFKNGIALVAGELVALALYEVMFDGTQFQIIGANQYVSPADAVTDELVAIPLNACELLSSTTAPVLTRNALGDKSFNRISAGAETITFGAHVPLHRLAAGKGYKLTKIGIAYQLAVVDATSVDVLCQSVAYAFNASPVVSAAHGGAIVDGDYDANHNTAAKRKLSGVAAAGERMAVVTLNTPAFFVTSNALVDIETTFVLANTGTLKIRGYILTYTRVAN